MEMIRQRNGKIRPSIKTKEDKIHAFVTGQLAETDLTEKELELYHRWMQVWTLVMTPSYSPVRAITAHLKITNHRANVTGGETISRRTAEYDYRNACKCFGDVMKISKDAKRAILEEMQMKAFRLALSYHDVKGMNSAIKNLINIHGLDKDDPDAPNAQDKPTLFIMQVYAKDKEEPLTINLDEMGKVDEKQARQIRDAVEEEDDVTELEIKKMIDGKPSAEPE